MAEAELKKSISFSVLVLLAINAIIGTGIFFVPGIAAKIAGPASLVSWLGVAVIAILVAACFAELVGMYPKAGGVYEYTKQAFGEFGGFVVGWTSWIVANVTIAMLAIGSLEYLNAFFHMSGLMKLIIAILAVWLVNLVSFRGIDLSVKVLLIFSIVTILSLWTLMSWGVYYFDVSRIQFLDIFPKVSLVIAMVYILETFFGWETVANLAEETKNPEKVVPKVMMIGTLAVTVLAIGVVSVALGAVDWRVLAESTSPLTDVAMAIMGPTGALILTALIFLNIFGGAAAWIVTAPRLIFALGRDGLLPRSLGKVHPKYKTPYVAIAAQTVLTTIVLLSGSYQLLLEMLLPMAIFMYAMVVSSVTVLRFTEPETPRTFKVPFGKVMPVVIALILVFLAGGIEFITTITAGMFVILGIPLYLIAGIGSNPEIAKKMIGFAPGVQKMFYRYYARKYHKDILNFFNDLKSGSILNIGCNIGELSKDLSKLVGPVGKIFATEVSDHDVNTASKSAKKENLLNIHFAVEDAEHRHNIHPQINNLHAVTSIGFLGYLEDPSKVLSELNHRLVAGGRIYFVDYDKIFKLLRANQWLRDDENLKQLFQGYGFNVQVNRKKGLLWDTIHIYGHKVGHAPGQHAYHHPVHPKAEKKKAKAEQKQPEQKPAPAPAAA